MQSFTVTESTAATLPISANAAAALTAAGTRLTSKRGWWRQEDVPAGDDSGELKTVIRCTPVGTSWSVRVVDAVGVVSVPGVQLIVEPKIPLPHFIYLLARGASLPRLDQGSGLLAAGTSFWELLARWFVSQADSVLRRDLARDYQVRREELAIVRGHVLALPTVRDLLKGRIALHCEYDDFTTDTALNRLLSEAARLVAGSSVLPWDLRRAAIAIRSRLDDVGEFVLTDLTAQTDRRTGYYADAIAIAKEIIRNSDRDLAEGASRVWTFLIRTPEPVEAGVRAVLADHLPSRLVKRGIQLTPSYHTLNPDLVFDQGDAVGDVKYKLAGSDWARADLFQVVAFATGFHAHSAAVISFRRQDGSAAPDLQVGAVRLRHFTWRAELERDPGASATELAKAVRAWLDSPSTPSRDEDRPARPDARPYGARDRGAMA